MAIMMGSELRNPNARDARASLQSPISYRDETIHAGFCSIPNPFDYKLIPYGQSRNPNIAIL